MYGAPSHLYAGYAAAGQSDSSAHAKLCELERLI